MMRNPTGGLIDRNRPLSFTFNARQYTGYAGDTLASALLANSVRIVGRSFKYHRPRGVFGIGAEEPNALVQLGAGPRTDPNSKATEIELFDGLVASSQNCWPSAERDLYALTGLFAPLLPAGFYYKTFMWPPRRWLFWERFIRPMAGHGVAPREPDPDRYEHAHAHCDVLVVGAGPAGLSATLAASRAGVRVLLVDDQAQAGGSLRGARQSIDGRAADAWIASSVAELRESPEVTILERATAFGYYDHNQVGVLERVADHRPAKPGEPRQRVWHVHARRVVLATGSHERHLVFGNNDLPGVMLASAAAGYANRFAVRAGSRAAVFTNNDSGYDAALDLASAGVEVRAVIDARSNIDPAHSDRLRDAGIDHCCGAFVSHAYGSRTLEGVETGGRRIACDLLAVSGGWNPAVQLHAQARGRPRFEPAIAAYAPGESFQAECSAGAANGAFSTEACLAQGAEAGRAAAAGRAPTMPACTRPKPAAATEAPSLWRVPAFGRRRKCFIDLQNDVTDADVALAVREGYRSVEHVKRYTTLGMGTEQGKTSNTLGFAGIAEARHVDIETVGVTMHRPPYVPVALGALAGQEGGRHFLPQRRTPMHDWHVENGATMLQSGPWLRPQAYPRPGETLDDACHREADTVRCAVGVVDVSTLGKFELRGPDVATFLDRVCAARIRNLQPGRSRYFVMLREDGIVFDDGTVTRLDAGCWFMTTTTGQSALLARRLQHCRHVLWPELDLHIVQVTEAWAGVAVAGPHSREVLARVSALDASLPHMGARECEVTGMPARVMRISFSGERAFEIYVQAGYGTALWAALVAAGRDLGIAPYGVDALNVLRVEKGHVAGAELDGRTTMDDLGLGRMAKPEGDYIGRRSLSRPAFQDPGRWQLVGLVPEDGRTPVPPGAKIVGDAPDRYIGEVTSTALSPAFGQPIALALVAGGRSRHGARVIAASPLFGLSVPVTIRSPHFYDPAGDRLHA